jgi:hypothetical protein
MPMELLHHVCVGLDEPWTGCRSAVGLRHFLRAIKIARAGNPARAIQNGEQEEGESASCWRDSPTLAVNRGNRENSVPCLPPGLDHPATIAIY